MTVAASPILVLLAILVVVALLAGARSRTMAWAGLSLVGVVAVCLAIVHLFAQRDHTRHLKETRQVAQRDTDAHTTRVVQRGAKVPVGRGHTAEPRSPQATPEVPEKEPVSAAPVEPPVSAATAARAHEPPPQRPGRLAAFFRALAAAVDGGRNVKIARRNAYGALVTVAEKGSALTAPPEWIEAASRWLDDGAVYQTTALTPFVKREGILEEIDDTLCRATQDYVEEHIGREFGESLPLNGKELRRLIADRYYEFHTVEVGGDRQPLVRAHLLLAFDETAHDQLQEVYDRVATEQRRISEETAAHERELTIAWRLRAAGGILAGILGMLGLAYGYLRIDLATEGQYRGRLRAAAVLVILAGIAAAVFTTL